MVVSNPGIHYYGCHAQNTTPRPANVYYEGIVIHTTAGGSTIEGLAAWFGGLNVQQGLRGSTTHGTDRAGKIGCFVQPYANVQPIANGQESGSTYYLVRQNPGLSANTYTLNIEHLDAGMPGSITEIQFQRTIHLCAYLWQEYIQPYAYRTGATLDLNHIGQHKDYAPVSKPICASWPLDRMQRLVAGMQAMLAPPEPEPIPPDPEPEPQPPVTDWEAAYKSLEQKHAQLDREAEQWTVDDEIGAQLRRKRLAELRAWQP